MGTAGSDIGNSNLPSTSPDNDMFRDALADVDMLGGSFYSGAALSSSVADEAYVLAGENAFDPVPLRSGGAAGVAGYSEMRRGKSGNVRRARKQKPKSQNKSSGSKKSYKCAICAKDFAGASGLWYHNKHVHGAVTQQRPRKPKNVMGGENG